MADTTHVKGLAELQKMLDTLPVKLEKNIMRGALRAGMRPVRVAARQNINSVSGLLAKGLTVGTKVQGSRVIANLKAKGPHGFVAKFLEYGTSAHTIMARAGAGALRIGGRFRSAVRHPGSRQNPFMRPALDTQAQAALRQTGEYVRARLTKAGLDAAQVRLEGDE